MTNKKSKIYREIDSYVRRNLHFSLIKKCVRILWHNRIEFRPRVGITLQTPLTSAWPSAPFTGRVWHPVRRHSALALSAKPFFWMMRSRSQVGWAVMAWVGIIITQSAKIWRTVEWSELCLCWISFKYIQKSWDNFIPFLMHKNTRSDKNKCSVRSLEFLNTRKTDKIKTRKYLRTVPLRFLTNLHSSNNQNARTDRSACPSTFRIFSLGFKTEN